MPMRLHEIHPSIVHFPLALAPLSFALDAIGRLTRRRAFMQVARTLMPVAAGSAVATGVTGLIAQESVQAKGKAHDLLVTHRNLNIGLTGSLIALAVLRMRTREPSVGYLLAGLAGVAGMTYTAYLGGRMVYDHGVGVRNAGGVREGEAPALTLDSAGEALRKTGQHAVEGVKQVARETREGMIAPALREGAS